MYNHKDLLGLRGLMKDDILSILDNARLMKKRVENPSLRSPSLERHSAVTLFYECSTRTRMSFTMAAEYLGMRINDLGVSASSVQKGERLIDTGKTLDAMGVSVMIMRHNLTGAAHLLAKHVRAAVINGGDGCNEHPTQALLDMFTIAEKKGGFDGLKVAIIGDIIHSRVARSNAFGLSALGARVFLAGPPTLISRHFERLGPSVTVTDSVNEAVRDADVIMGLRVQLERQKAAAFPDLREYARFYGITAEILEMAKPGALIMHPAPVNRGVEMTSEVIDHDRSVINEQVTNGVAVRMAVLEMLGARG
ncbi:MAG: aspartate carbamoyltransferase catalytic subunit [Clostridiales bacterium]|jgi:aspartate carbamoyltransferase catalytic subunit|nr:aspartate carbamoyltransferase catalytic subunit [Clostridiales bacterium]